MKTLNIKKIISIGMLCLSISISAQTLSYNDMGVLLSDQHINGTARFNALSGAFGALGGDLSAIDVNPAGAAVFKNSELAASLNFRNNTTLTNFYGNTINNENEYTHISQAGAVFVFNTNTQSDWKNLVLGFNYSRANEFENNWVTKGNSKNPTWTGDEKIDKSFPYTESYGQKFSNFTKGENTRYTFSIASQLKDIYYFGASLNSYDVDFYQQTQLKESNHDGKGNKLDASLSQQLSTYGDGVSISLGVIAKPIKNLRLGLSYQSPIWYSLSEDFIKEDSELKYSNTGGRLAHYSGVNNFSYKVRTPSKITGSTAYVFNKYGLLSIDYIYTNYSNINFQDNDFIDENNAVKNELKGTSEVRIGTEWRFDSLSIRGGYHMQQNPYKSALSSDDISGFSLGAGFNFRGFKLDIAYQKDTNTAAYNFYPEKEYNINSTELDIDTSKITATLTIKI